MNWTVYADGEVLARSVVSDPKFQIADPRVTAEVNKAGTFEFTIYPEHPYYDKLFKMKTLLRVELNDETIFDGRVLYTQTAMNRSRKVYCEGVMAYLLDSIQESHEYNKNTPQYYDMTVADYVDQLLINHNLMFIDGPAKDRLANMEYGSVETDGTAMQQFRAKLQALIDEEAETGEETIRFSDPEKIIYTGTVNAVGSAGYGVSGKYKFEVTGHSKTLDVLQNTLVETIGGYMRVQRRMNAGDTEPHLYLDWTNNFDGVNTQSIDFGVNMLDFTMDESGVDVFTRLYPTGKPSGSSKDTEVIFYPSEDGSKIIGIMENAEDQKALEDRYGVIVRAVEFSDCDNAETLKKLVWNYVERYASGLPEKLSLTALDLRSYGVNILQMGIGRKLTANARRSHGLYRSDMACISIDYYLRAPDKNTYVLSSAPTGADATPKFSTQQSATASTASSARRSASSAARTAETAQTAASTAVNVASEAATTANTALEDVAKIYKVTFVNGYEEGTADDEKSTYARIFAEALGLAIDETTGLPETDIDGNLVSYHYYKDKDGNYREGSMRSMVETKVDSARLISEINAKEHYEQVTLPSDTSGVNPYELGYYWRSPGGDYVPATENEVVKDRVYYTQTAGKIKSSLVEAAPGSVLIEAINNAGDSQVTIRGDKLNLEAAKTVIIKALSTAQDSQDETTVKISADNINLDGYVKLDGNSNLTLESGDIYVNDGIIQARGISVEHRNEDNEGGYYNVLTTYDDVVGSIDEIKIDNETGEGTFKFTMFGADKPTVLTFDIASTKFYKDAIAEAEARGASDSQFEIKGVRAETLLPATDSGHFGTGTNADKYVAGFESRFTVLREREYTDDQGEKAIEYSNVGPLSAISMTVDATAVYNAGRDSNGVKEVTVTKDTYGDASTRWLQNSYAAYNGGDGLVDLGGYYYVEGKPHSGTAVGKKFRVPSITSLEAGELGQTTEDEPGKWVATLPLTAKYGSQVLKTSNVEIDVTSAYSAGFTNGGGGQGVDDDASYVRGWNAAVEAIGMPSAPNDGYDMTFVLPHSIEDVSEEMRTTSYTYEIGIFADDVGSQAYARITDQYYNAYASYPVESSVNHIEADFAGYSLSQYTNASSYSSYGGGEISAETTIYPVFTSKSGTKTVYNTDTTKRLTVSPPSNVGLESTAFNSFPNVGAYNGSALTEQTVEPGKHYYASFKMANESSSRGYRFYVPKSGTANIAAKKTKITKAGTYRASEDSLDGWSSVEVVLPDVATPVIAPNGSITRRGNTYSIPLEDSSGNTQWSGELNVTVSETWDSASKKYRRTVSCPGATKNEDYTWEPTSALASVERSTNLAYTNNTAHSGINIKVGYTKNGKTYYKSITLSYSGAYNSLPTE